MRTPLTITAAFLAATLAAPLASADQPTRDRRSDSEYQSRGKRDRVAPTHRLDRRRSERPRAERRTKRPRTQWRRSERPRAERGRSDRFKQRQRRTRRGRADRRNRQIGRYRARWDRGFLASRAARSELAVHSRRIARLERMKRLARHRGSGDLLRRIESAIARENRRHDREMRRLKLSHPRGY